MTAVMFEAMVIYGNKYIAKRRRVRMEAHITSRELQISECCPYPFETKPGTEIGKTFSFTCTVMKISDAKPILKAQLSE